MAAGNVAGYGIGEGRSSNLKVCLDLEFQILQTQLPLEEI